MKREKELQSKGYQLRKFSIEDSNQAKEIAKEYRAKGYNACIVKYTSSIVGLYDYGVWIKEKSK